MILGVGIDIVDIRRIEKTLTRWGERFTQRVFTATERERSDRRLLRAESYAKRYAAKEACAKALGTGLARGVLWTQMEVINLPGGKPVMKVHAGALARLQSMIPSGYEPLIELSLTDEPPYAQALVIISARPIIVLV